MSELIGTRFHSDASAKTFTVERVQDVEPILEHNKVLRALPQKSDWGRHVASIPNVLIERWLNEEHARGNRGMTFGSKEFDALITRKLRDPEWAYLRTDR